MAWISLITVAFSQLRLARRRKNVAKFAQAKIDDFLARARHQIVGSADHELQILALRTSFAASTRFRSQRLDVQAASY